MTFTRSSKISNPKFVDGTKVYASELNHIEDQLIYALDGYAGGTYNPSAFINIGGSGFNLSTGLIMSGGDLTIEAGGIGATNGGVFGGTVIMNTLNVTGNTHLTGTLRVDGYSNVRNELAVDGALLASGAITANNGIAIVGGGLEVEGGSITVLPGVVSTFEEEIILSNAGGRIRYRVSYAPNANASYDITTTDYLVIQTSIAGTNNAYTLNHTGASVGNVITVVNASSHLQGIYDVSEGLIRTIPATGSGTPTVGTFLYMNNGSGTTRWWEISETSL